MANVGPASIRDLSAILDSSDPSIYEVTTKADGPAGSLPLTDEMLRDWPSGDLFGLTQNAGMGWTATEVARDPYLILSTQGGLRGADGQPIALGYHTGHWEIGLLVQAAAEELRRLGVVPFAGMVSDPCDGRTQGTAGMMDSLPYRNDAAIVFRRLIRSLPRRKGVLGIATCDKGLPAMMMALAGSKHLPGVLVPGGVTLPPTRGRRRRQDPVDRRALRPRRADAAGSRRARLPGLRQSRRRLPVPGHGGHVAGRRRGAGHDAAARRPGPLGPADLARHGPPLGPRPRRTGRAGIDHWAMSSPRPPSATPWSSTRRSAARPTCCSTSRPSPSPPACTRPTVDDWHAINVKVPRLVERPAQRAGRSSDRPRLSRRRRARSHAAPAGARPARLIGPHRHRRAARSACSTGGRRASGGRGFASGLFEQDGVDPDDVIMSPSRARERGLTSTVTFPRGNLAPEGSVIKSTAIDPSVVDADGVYRKTGPARVFTRERDAIAAIKGQGERPIQPGDVLVLIGRGPMGAGMEEIYQITSALKHLSFGKHVAVLTDARFSGVSTGACIGHVGPEALAGGPIGKVRDGDLIRIVIDRDQPRRVARPGRRRRSRVRARRRGPRPRRAIAASPALARSRPARRHPALGGLAGRRRRHLGRLRLRYRRDHRRFVRS